MPRSWTESDILHFTRCRCILKRQITDNPHQLSQHPPTNNFLKRHHTPPVYRTVASESTASHRSNEIVTERDMQPLSHNRKAAIHHRTAAFETVKACLLTPATHDQTGKRQQRQRSRSGFRNSSHHHGRSVIGNTRTDTVNNYSSSLIHRKCSHIGK